MKTLEDIEKLKTNWLNDTCWDIEDTEGFEDHYIELKQFRLEIENKRDLEYNTKLLTIANKIGIHDNIKLLEYIIHLENRIEKLEDNNK